MLYRTAIFPVKYLWTHRQSYHDGIWSSLNMPKQKTTYQYKLVIKSFLKNQKHGSEILKNLLNGNSHNVTIMHCVHIKENKNSAI